MAVFSYAPWPYRENGISVRYFPVLAALDRTHDLTIIVLGDADAALRPPPDEFRNAHCEILDAGQSARSLGARISARGRGIVPWGAPYCLTRPADAAFARLLHQRMSSLQPDILLWVGREHGAVLFDLMSKHRRPRSVVDFVDSPTLVRSREVAMSAAASLSQRYDLWKTRRWEQSIRRRADQTIYVAEPDSDAAGAVANDRTQVIPNGFSMESEAAISRLAEGRVIGFFGHMGYRPNVLAARRLHDDVFLPLKARYPDLRLGIIGRAPTAEVQALHDGKDVFVTGEVDDIAAHIAGLDVCVFPLSSGAGLQNKVLEALWLRRPCVVSTFVGRAAQMEHQRDGLLVDTDEEFVAAVDSLLRDPHMAAGLGDAGHGLIEEKYDMGMVLSRFQEAIDG